MPPRHLLPLKADDPPRGRILVVEKDVTRALELQRLLRDLDYRVLGPASSSQEARQMIERARSAGTMPIDCALLDVNVPGIADVGKQLAAEAIRFIWVAPAGELPTGRLDAPLLSLPCHRRALFDAVTRRIAGTREFEGEPGLSRRSTYPKPPPQEVWPRVWPQL